VLSGPARAALLGSSLRRLRRLLCASLQRGCAPQRLRGLLWPRVQRHSSGCEEEALVLLCHAAGAVHAQVACAAQVRAVLQAQEERVRLRCAYEPQNLRT